MLEKGKIES